MLCDPESVENIIATTPGLDKDPAVLSESNATNGKTHLNNQCFQISSFPRISSNLDVLFSNVIHYV